MAVEFETIEHRADLKEGGTGPEKREASATRISISNPEIVYPYLDHIDELPDIPLPPVVIPYQYSLQATELSFRGTALHMAQNLALTFSRHKFNVEPEVLKQHFPTVPEEGLSIMSDFAKLASRKHRGADRLYHIYRYYIEAQEGLFADDQKIPVETLKTLWNSSETDKRAKQFIANIDGLYRANRLKVSNPKTNMQFDVGIIANLKDLKLQVPMSLDMIVKEANKPAHLTDLKIGQMPDVQSEISLHQRYLMAVSAWQYIQTWQGDSPSYFGDFIVLFGGSARPAKSKELGFYYTSDRLVYGGDRFTSSKANIEGMTNKLVYESLQKRAEQINNNKPRVRKLIALYKKSAAVTPMRSVFHPPKGATHYDEFLEDIA